MLTGYNRRIEREMVPARNIMAFIKAFGGMGATEFTSPQTLLPLSIDDENKKHMITTLAQAKKLLKEFM